MNRPAGPEPITGSHVLAEFDCGVPEMNRWLIDVALRAEGQTARTFVLHRRLRVVGFYSLSMASVRRADAPRFIRKDTPPEIPCVRLGRLAVDLREQHSGLGSALVKDAITKAVVAATQVGAKALLVDAIDLPTRGWYESTLDFVQSPTHPLQVYRSIQDIINAMP